MEAVDRQRDYYRATAADYDAMHVRRGDEHDVALSLFSGLVRPLGAVTVLDVGAGTGRGIDRLRELLPEASILGLEPVAELRAIGHARGIPEDMLVEGDALALPYPDDCFDFVVATGILHHIPTPAEAVREIVRVARQGVLLSDSNNLGQGRAAIRMVKALVHGIGLWRTMIWLTTGGRMAKFSEGDGVYFSYSLFDDLPLVRAKFPRLHLVNTAGLTGQSLKYGAPQVACMAFAGDL